ncbi:glycosyltransferase family 2 protein [Chryseobacterium sp. SC28]|uniref:glycosyltransferase family 2 protein n=1 Tax=Chryseobacterium sp. SC28 TaxID=2268028 RepID=UPI000F6466FA|nr:glycosyltransferase family 2 protein [Chryseobacterium sp. SC28]RRQ45853.1 glycosyltransferase [Chryseobacterium sp. SC28]
MKASIIITTFRRPAFLEKAILSCLHQHTDFSFEVIVVDDNGKHTEWQQQTEAALPTDARIKYLALEKNSGACVARNEGAAFASGDYLFFLDDDDAFLPNKLDVQIRFLETHADYDGCLAAFKRIGSDGKEIIADSNYPVVGDFKNFVLRGNFFTPMICIRKTSFTKSGGFIDIPRFQDRFYMMHLLRAGFRFGVLRDQLHLMYEHSEDRITSRSLEKTQISVSLIDRWMRQFRNEFSSEEWMQLQYNSLRTMAVTKYNATSRSERISASASFLRLFSMKKKGSDIFLMFKSLIK